MTVNDNIIVELQNHQTRLDNAKQITSDHFRACIENTETQLATYSEYEKQAHSRRLIAISMSFEIDPNDQLPFVIV